jgi:hypothetical protein
MIVTDEYSEDSRPEGAAEAPAEAETITTEEPAASEGTADPAPQYGVGPFSIREVALGGSWLIAFIASFFPVYGEIGTGPTVWGSGIDWVLMIGVPTVAVFLIVLRRLSPQGIRRVGSLGIDQFASVAFSVAAVLWLAIIWKSFITLFGQSVFAGTWVVWVEFIMMLAGVFLTVLAPFIAPFNQDFLGRTEVPAHRVARPARPVTPRPVTPRPAAPAAEAAATPSVYADYAAPAQPVESAPAAAAGAARASDSDAAPYWDADGDVVGADDRTGATTTVLPVAEDDQVTEVTPAEQSAEESESPTAREAEPAAAESASEPVVPAQHQAFWALVPEERDVVDEIGIPVFRIGPTAWALVIEDRGEVFVVRHEDGRIGYLHDVSGVTRG